MGPLSRSGQYLSWSVQDKTTGHHYPQFTRSDDKAPRKRGECGHTAALVMIIRYERWLLMVIDGTRHQTSAAVPRVLLACVVLNKETNIALKFSLACLISYGTINFNISFDIYVPCWKNIFVSKSTNRDFDLHTY